MNKTYDIQRLRDENAAITGKLEEHRAKIRVALGYIMSGHPGIALLVLGDISEEAVQSELPTDHQVLSAMRKYGGGFIASLGSAGFNADGHNLSRLKAAWPDEWHKYTALAKMDAQKEEA